MAVSLVGILGTPLASAQSGGEVSEINAASGRAVSVELASFTV